MKTETQITTEQFLEELFGSTEDNIFFNTNGKSWKDKPQTYSEAKSKLKWSNNKKDDIYFIPNSGGTKNSQITQINSSFIDWDAGKDSHGNYFPIEIVKQKKQEFLQKLSLFPYKPTYIIETRNGYHVYWFLYTGTTTEQFIIIQKQLIRQFNSDPIVYNPARVMRLPDYYASKSGKYSSFLVSIIEHNDIRYYADTFISYFSVDSLLSQNKDCDITEHTSLPSSEVRISAHNNTYINKVYTRSIIMGTKHQLNQKGKIIFNTMEEVVDYLCRQNIGEYLNLINNTDISQEGNLVVNCPFHNDGSPSASIYYHKDYCYLKCHSSECSFDTGTIIQIVRKKDELTEGDSVIKLMEYYNIEMDDTWKTEEDSKYINNIKIINQCNEWKEIYPYLYRCINRIKIDLLSKLLFAKDHIKLRTSEGKSLFFCSLTEFERASKQDPYLEDQNRQNERVDRYCLLGLMDKLDEGEIPCGFYRMLQQVKGNKRFKYRMQCYHIPEYTSELLRRADNIACIAKEKGMKLNSITKNSIRDIFGDSMAVKVYPQTEEISPSDSGMTLFKLVEKVLMEEISSKGYATTSIVKDILERSTTWKTVHDRRVKEHLPGIFEKNELVEITANKLLKKCIR